MYIWSHICFYWNIYGIFQWVIFVSWSSFHSNEYVLFICHENIHYMKRSCKSTLFTRISSRIEFFIPLEVVLSRRYETSLKFHTWKKAWKTSFFATRAIKYIMQPPTHMYVHMNEIVALERLTREWLHQSNAICESDWKWTKNKK